MEMDSTAASARPRWLSGWLGHPLWPTLPYVLRTGLIPPPPRDHTRQARAEPVALDSFTPPLARQFAQRQLQLMQAGAAREQAFTQAEQELAGRLQALRR